MVTPNSLSDHCIVTCSIQQPTSSKLSFWTKIFPNAISTSHFRYDFLQTFTMLDDFPSLDNWTEFKTKLVSNSKFSYSQVKFKHTAQICKTRKFFQHLEENAPKNGFSLEWSQKWNATFNLLKRMEAWKYKISQIQAGSSWIANSEKSNKYYLSRFLNVSQTHLFQ